MTNTSGKVRVTKRDNPYINIDKTSINDKGLSWGAKGLFTYILGLPPNWTIYISELSNHSTVGYTGTVSLLDELIKAGYIKRTALRNEKGHFSGYDYECFEQPLPIEQRTVLKEKYKRPKTDKPKAENTEHGQTKYGETNYGETLSKDYPVQQVSKEVINEGKEVSVVTDTPPLESETNLSEIPTGSEMSSTEIPNNCENENLSLKEKSRTEKANSGAGGENSQSDVSNSKKPKKAAREWFKLSSLTDEQKGKIRELARGFDSPGDFGESLKQWLEYKEAGEVNFRNQKINPYKNFETMFKEVTTEANKCKGQSDVFKQTVQHSIDKLYLGLFPEKFINKNQQQNGAYHKQTATERNNEFMRNIKDHLPS